MKPKEAIDIIVDAINEHIKVTKTQKISTVMDFNMTTYQDYLNYTMQDVFDKLLSRVYRFSIIDPITRKPCQIKLTHKSMSFVPNGRHPFTLMFENTLVTEDTNTYTTNIDKSLTNALCTLVMDCEDDLVDNSPLFISAYLTIVDKLIIQDIYSKKASE